jgi:hypothetical protein
MNTDRSTVSINEGPAIDAGRFSEIANALSRPRHILQTILALTHEAIANQIEEVELAAAEAAGDTDDDKPVVAKLSLAISWPAGEPIPEVTVKSSYSVKRTNEATALADGDQGKLPFGAGEEFK